VLGKRRDYCLAWKVDPTPAPRAAKHSSEAQVESVSQAKVRDEHRCPALALLCLGGRLQPGKVKGLKEKCRCQGMAARGQSSSSSSS
jgi:hypothetical protein